MKVFLNIPYFHHMNEQGLRALLKYLNYDVVRSKRRADIIFSPSKYLNTKRYPDKIYIFGPHFSALPNKQAKSLSNAWGNAAYIFPSKEIVDFWVNEYSFSNIDCYTFPFPLLLNLYPVAEEPKDQILVYYKMRDPKDLERVCHFLDEKKEKYKVIKYWHYKEEDYQRELGRTKFVLWLGCHESQGFALQSALAKNVPILCWSVKKMKQEWGCSRSYEAIKTEVSSAPYWDERCGIKFYEFQSLPSSYHTIIENLSVYAPRSYIEENLTVAVCAKNFIQLIEKIKEKMQQVKQHKKVSLKEKIMQKIFW